MHFSTACQDHSVIHTFSMMDQLACFHDLSRDTFARVAPVDGEFAFEPAAAYAPPGEEVACGSGCAVEGVLPCGEEGLVDPDGAAVVPGGGVCLVAGGAVDGLPVDGEFGVCAAVIEGAAGVAMGGGCTNAGKVIELTTEGSSCSFI